MFGSLFGQPRVKNLSPFEVKAAMDEGTAVLIDVREVHEFKSERIAGAINLPLSKLASTPLPEAGDKTIILQCASGMRSAQAMNICKNKGGCVEHHLKGGIMAWKAQGLPTIR